LKIEKQIQDDHQAKLIVEVEQEQMDAFKRRAARKLAERGKIPGFRPGKAPYNIIVRHFGEEAVTEQAIELLVDDIYPKVLDEAKVEPAAAGSLENIEKDGDTPKLTFRVPLAPEVELGDYTSVRLPYEWVAPDQSAVDAAMEDLRQRYASTETVDRDVQVGDYVLVDVNGAYAKPKEGDEDKSAGLSRTGFATFVREQDRDEEWPFKAFNKELVGLKPGESKTIKHKYAKDDADENLRGETVNFEVKVKTVRGVILPDLDDDFAKQVGAGETLDTLKEAVARDVENHSRGEYDDKYFVELIEKIKEGATIKYSQHSVEHESEHVLNDLQQRLSQQGMDLPTYFKLRNTTQEKFVEEEVHPVAKKRLERSLLLDEIIRKEKIEVDNAALDAEFTNTLTELQMQGMNLNEIKGGRKEQQRIAEAVAMESASRIMTRRALETIKSIAMGEYKAPESAEGEAAAEAVPAEGEKKPKKKAAPKAKASSTKTEGAEPAEKKTVKKSTKKSETESE
jgi:trigger factor